MAPSMVSTAGRMPIKLSQGFRALWGGVCQADWWSLGLVLLSLFPGKCRKSNLLLLKKVASATGMFPYYRPSAAKYCPAGAHGCKHTDLILATEMQVKSPLTELGFPVAWVPGKFNWISSTLILFKGRDAFSVGRHRVPCDWELGDGLSSWNEPHTRSSAI